MTAILTLTILAAGLYSTRRTVWHILHTSRTDEQDTLT